MSRITRAFVFVKILILISALYVLSPPLETYDDLFKYPIRSNVARPDNETVVRFIEKLQHPEDCDSARKFLCPFIPHCGFGCMTHKLVDCFIYAGWTNRTVVLDPTRGPIITKDSWEHYFLPISENCTSWSNPVEWGPDHEQHQVVKLSTHFAEPTPGLEEWLKISPPWIPAPSTIEFPIAWYAGHILQYIYRLQPSMVDHVRAAKDSIGFDLVQPIPGMHVRRTDKKGEAPYQPVEAYMPSIQQYFERKENGTVKRVYLATDEPNVVTELQNKYPDYTFLSDSGTVSGANRGSRYTAQAHLGIITDLQLLMSCEFVVCTLSSNICRLVYEVQNSRMWNVNETFHSADHVYHFW